MFDHIKISTTNKFLIEKIKHNGLLEWNSKFEKLNNFDKETINTKEIKTYKQILFCFYDNRLDILIKPHYYKNNGTHNANDFTKKECIKVLDQISEVICINEYKNDFKVLNIEFGVNITSPIDCKNLVNFISYHTKNQFVNDTDLRYSKKSYRNQQSSKYKLIKAYNKHIQFPEYCHPNTFRFEIKSKKSRYINGLGIKSLNDLYNDEVYKNISIELIKEWKEILILGFNQEFQNLTSIENKNLNKYLNPHNWYNIIQKHRNTFNQSKKRYFKLLDKTGFNIHSAIGIIIQNKTESLLK